MPEKQLEHSLDLWFGKSATFLLGAIYILLVLFIPLGIAGTWRARSFCIKEGWSYLVSLLTGEHKTT